MLESESKMLTHYILLIDILKGGNILLYLSTSWSVPPQQLQSYRPASVIESREKKTQQTWLDKVIDYFTENEQTLNPDQFNNKHGFDVTVLLRPSI